MHGMQTDKNAESESARADATLYCRVTADGLPVGPVSEAAAYDEGAVVTSEFACGCVCIIPH